MSARSLSRVPSSAPSPMMTSMLFALVLAASTAACRDRAAGPVTSADAGSPSSAGAAADASLGLAGLGGIVHGGRAFESAPLVIPTGNAAPMPSGATDAEREKELVALLSGRVDPDALPVVATDRDASFDEGLRENLISPTRFHPEVRYGTIEVQGALPVDGAKRTIAQSRPRARACYELALRTKPELQGSVHVRAEVARSGEVTKAAITLAPTRPGLLVADEALNACITRIVRGLSFSDTDAGSSVVTYDIRFSSAEDTAVRGGP